MSGSADLDLLARVGPSLKQLHGEVTRLGAQSVTLDIRELYFMNSSCLSAFVSWIVGMSKADVRGRYRIRFLSHLNLRWQ